ncbi:hypothetical protein [Nocardia transvalensis]|uniref:hypothetical protein n=1 Tax=Nocardia transvalensis TaxID=37333 RepID=UPI001894ACA3|nr:hypothetical protein [Nocardia transvalensis]MBF6327529.1 hypothetical protein [Nocardia transvalensis]
MGGNVPNWRAVAAQARSGGIELKHDAALACAQACVRTVDRLRGIKEKGVARVDGADAIPDFSNLSSGITFAAKMREKGSEFGRIIDAHITVLTDMTDAFVAAGRTYDAAEGRSAEAFDKIRVGKTYTGGLSSDPPGSGRIPEPTAKGPITSTQQLTQDLVHPGAAGTSGSSRFPGLLSPDGRGRPIEDLPRDLTKSYKVPESLLEAGRFAALGVKAEPVDYMNYPRLHSLGLSIKAQPAADAAAVWGWIASEMNAQFIELNNNLSGAEGNWRGGGAQKAIGASKAYVTATTQVIGQAVQLRDNLYYTSGWLSRTRAGLVNMPPPDPKQDQDATWGKAVYSAFYASGMDTAGAKVPDFVTPSPVADPSSVGPGSSGGPGAPRGGSPLPKPGSPPPGSATPPVSGRPPGSDGPGDPLSKLGQQAGNALQTAADAAKNLGDANPGSAASMLPASASALDGAAGKTAGGGGKAGGGAGSGGGGAGSGAAMPGASALGRATSPFPRASASGPGVGGMAGRAGAAPMAGMPGTPGAAGAPGRGTGQDQDGKGHKRPDYLESTDHIDGALGTAQVVSRPVLDQ